VGLRGRGIHTSTVRVSTPTRPKSSTSYIMAIQGCCRHRRVASSSPMWAEGEAVTWRWLAGVTMAARRVVAIRREKGGGL
jgi:hypothetical protein